MVNSNFFGMHLNKTFTVWPTQYVGAYRCWDTQTNWYQLNPKAGVFDFAPLTQRLDKCQNAGCVDILYTFGRVPQWANGSTDNTVPPTDVDTGNKQFKDFVTALVKYNLDRKQQGKTAITQVEGYNEPYQTGMWKGTPAQLLKMHTTVRDVVKALDPSVAVYSPTLYWLGSSLKWFDQFYAAASGDLNALHDCIAFHHYTTDANPVTEDIPTNVAKIRDSLAAKGIKQDMVCTEGASLKSLTGLALAGDVVKRNLFLLKEDVKAFYWYCWDIHTPLVGTPGATAFGVLSSWLRRAELVDPLKKDALGTWRVTYAQPTGREITILWNEAGQLVTFDSRFTSLQDVTGTTTNLQNHNAQITASPVAVF